MSELNKDKIEAKGLSIRVYTEDFKNDYISLTDIARYKNKIEPNVVVANWLRNYNTIEYLGVWEQLYNANFNPIEFEGFLRNAGSNAFTLSPKKWIESTNAIGLISKTGRYGGTFAHKDIAFKFASWISVEFELYIIRNYASLNELLVLSNMESYNAVLIEKGLDQKERLKELRKLARTQMQSLEKLNQSNLPKLK